MARLVRFKADPTIFTETVAYNHDVLYDRLRQIAFLNKGIKLLFTDESMEDEVERTHTFLYEGGLKEYIAFLNQNKTADPRRNHLRGRRAGRHPG